MSKLVNELPFRVRLERIEQLKHGQTSLSSQLPQGEVAPLNLEPSLITKSKKRRYLPDIKEESSSSGDDSNGEDEEDLNWRAKAV